MQQVSLHKFVGAMDLDSSPENIPAGWHRNGRNIQWRGTKGDMRPENTPGTTLLWNNAPSGNNVCIGRWYDKVFNQIYFFIYNSNATHGIYIFDIASQAVTPLIVNGTNTDGDVLGFNANVTINSIWMMYGDDNSGNLLFWVDSLGRPSKCNVQRYLGLLAPASPPYNPIKRSYLDVAKAPPRMAPKCCYENDPNVQANFMSNTLFQFRTRYKYDDFETSVYSQPSIVALPNETYSQTAIFDHVQNCRESIWFPTGDADVKFIELWVKTSSDSAESDWLLIYSFEKAVLNIPDNSIYRYLFYNNIVLTSGDIEEIDQIYDEVPIAAGCGCLINGNTNAYGDVTEGYGPIPLNISMSSSNIQPVSDNMNGILFFAAQGGYDSDGPGDEIIVYLTGSGTNDSNGNPTTLPPTAAPFLAETWIVDCADSSGNSKKFSYTNSATNNIATILAGLQAAAIAQGFTISNILPNSFTATYTGIVLYGQIVTPNPSYVQGQAIFAYPHQDNEQWAPIYFDEKGRTPGAFIFPNNNLTTLADLTGATIPQNRFQINHRPPIWARYWTMGRGIQPPNPLFWICNQTFVNTDLNTGNQYVYIGISNMPLYDQDIEAATPVVKYDFAPGDRIQFLAQIPLTGGFNYLSVNNDYPIVSVEDAPLLNGIVQPGSFIKIAYPTSAIGGNFQFGTDPYQRFYIRIYHPIKIASAAAIIEGTQGTAGANIEEYFEAGRLYAIGNYGTANAFHIANTQTQKADLSQPAILTTSDGPYFSRQRNVPTGLQYQINMAVCSFSAHSEVFTTQASQQDVGVIDNTQYQINEQIQQGVGFGPGNYPQYNATNSDKAIFWNKLSTPQTLRLQATIPFNSTLSGTFYCALYFMNSTNVPPSVLQFLFRNFSAIETSTVQSYSQEVDVEIVVPANTQAWIFYAFIPSASTDFTCTIGGFTLTLQVVNPILVPIIESSFSDLVSLITNSDGRPFIYNENAGQFTYGTRYRYSQAYQLGTSVNNSNRFYAADYDELIKEYGSIVRMIIANDKNIQAFLTRRICVIGVYQKFIKNNEGATELVVSDDIITQNNAQYYAMPFGLGNQPDALAQYEYASYGVDPYWGIIWRLSEDGLIAISQLYKVQQFSGIRLGAYANAANNSYAPGGKVKILGAFHVKEVLPSEYILVAQQGVGVNGDTLTFDEKNNAFTGFHDYNPDMILGASNQLYSWKNGALYIHNNYTSGSYTSFYGVAYYPDIELIYNQNNETKKTFNVFQYYGNQFWEAFNVGDIKTSLFNPQTGFQQISQLIAQDFYINEGLYSAALLRDGNSQANQALAILQGDYLKGIWLSIKLTYRGNNFAYLYNPGLLWVPSPRNF